MVKEIFKIRGIDPLLFGDGRTFSDSVGAQLAKTLPLALPGTIASGLRTRYGRVNGWTWTKEEIERAFQLEVAGPLLRRNGKVVFPQPADSLIYEKKKNEQDTQIYIERLVPEQPGYAGGCDLPGNLRPLRVSDSFKPVTDYTYWHWENDASDKEPQPMDIRSWLLSIQSGSVSIEPDKLSKLLTEDRIHVAIQPGTQASEEGMLFRTRSLAFAHYPRWRPRETKENEAASAKPDEPKEQEIEIQWDMLVRFDARKDAESERTTSTNMPTRSDEKKDKDSAKTTTMHGPLTLGGERRMACLETASEADWPICPNPLAELGSVSQNRPIGLRLMLATPAIFQNGWLPEWLALDSEGYYTGTLPVTWGKPENGSVTLKLISAAMKRREAISGWDLEKGKAKPVRWMVPAGSIYFFEVSGEVGAFCKQTWLCSLCDGEQERRDGYGLALWGVW